MEHFGTKIVLLDINMPYHKLSHNKISLGLTIFNLI